MSPRWIVASLLLLFLFTNQGKAIDVTFMPGDVFVSLEDGPVQWWLPNGTLNRVLVGSVVGTGEGMAFDAVGNLYVSRWCVDPLCTTSGNTVEQFDVFGRSHGAVGGGYDCSPHAVAFDLVGNAYVGQAGCSGDVLKFAPGMMNPIAFNVVPENQGSFWIDVTADGCRVFYTSVGPNVKRFNMCTGAQLKNFNQAPLPGGVTHDLRILPDGGVLVSSGQVIARLNAAGALVATYGVGEASLWAGLDLLDDGTFWAANYESSNVYRFDLATGALRGGFNTGTPSHSIVGIRVKK